jgi:hypothetical protein
MTAPELPEFVDAEIAVEGVRSAVDEERLRQVVGQIPGVEDPNLYGGLLALQYDPVSTTKTKICDALIHAGFAVSVLRTAPASPVTDAMQH